MTAVLKVIHRLKELICAQRNTNLEHLHDDSDIVAIGSHGTTFNRDLLSHYA